MGICGSAGDKSLQKMGPTINKNRPMSQWFFIAVVRH
jgi:hypothetical protein